MSDQSRVAPRAAASGVTPRSQITGRLLSRLAVRLRWLIAVRLLVITSLVVPYALTQFAALQGEAEPTTRFDLLYLLAGITYAASLVYLLLLRLLRDHPALQAYIQFLGDLALVTGLVYHFGGMTSPFSILYLIVITVASFLLERRAGVAVATLAWLLYAGTTIAIARGWLPPPAATEASTSIWRYVYYLATHLFGFYAVAVMTSRLARSVTVAERELLEKRQDLAELQVVHRDVVESIPSGLLTTDLEGTVTSANLAARRILGRRQTDLLGSSILAIGLFKEQQWRQVTSPALAPADARRELSYRRGEASLTIGYSVSRLTGEDGATRGFIVIFQDLSDWRKLQEELRIKDRMAAVGELASGIAHEIGNPLAAISGSVQMLSGSHEGPPAQEKLLKILLRESQRLDRTIKGFLKFARPKERSSVRFDIAALLAEHVELLRNSPEVTDEHRLLLDVTPSSLPMVADPDQISQIFWNLSRNALRAMPAGGELGILGTLDGDTFRIVFTDNGRGMSEEERTNLFHPFQSAFDGGTGIGMAIVYQIVQEHGGRLQVSSAPGEGTRIVVELPATRVADQVAVEA